MTRSMRVTILPLILCLGCLLAPGVRAAGGGQSAASLAVAHESGSPELIVSDDDEDPFNDGIVVVAENGVESGDTMTLKLVQLPANVDVGLTVRLRSDQAHPVLDVSVTVDGSGSGFYEWDPLAAVGSDIAIAKASWLSDDGPQELEMDILLDPARSWARTGP